MNISTHDHFQANMDQNAARLAYLYAQRNIRRGNLKQACEWQMIQAFRSKKAIELLDYLINK